MTTLDTLRQLQARLSPTPWRIEQRGVLVDANGTDLIDGWDGEATLELAAAAPTHLADLITALEREQRIREVHKPTECRCGCSTECIHCQTSYPCPTIRILDGNE